MKLFFHKQEIHTTIREVVNHPAFSGFGHLVLPLDGWYDEDMPLSRIASVLPYHSNVKAGAVTDTLNSLIDEVLASKTLFYRFYTEEQIKNDPSKKDTGLFFLRGAPDAPFAVICPGGGFSYVGSVHEGFPHALELSKKAYNAFVLKYRVGRGETVACEDLAAAVSYIVANAKTLGLGSEQYSLWGSSAGARMVAHTGSSGAVAYGGAFFLCLTTVLRMV